MPKKTRQEKIAAKLRHLQEQQKKAAPVEALTSETVPAAVNLKSLTSKESLAPVREANYSYVFSDLRKTAFFAVLALVFEIILSAFFANRSFFG